MKGALLQDDLDTFKPLVDWLEQRALASDPVSTAVPADAGESARAQGPW
jgi:hypothetical protein